MDALIGSKSGFMAIVPFVVFKFPKRLSKDVSKDVFKERLKHRSSIVINPSEKS